ncbi:MAG: hypothetical protein H6591_11050 [Flavobacteriales bacterium]|nr:hypothetical protein [Flavobacteriales bacterium]
MGRKVLAALLILLLGRYVAAAFYAHPFGDDFSYAVAGVRTALLPRLWDEFNLWNGRWASNPLLLRGPLVLGLEPGLGWYRVVPVALLVLLLAAARSLAKALLPALRASDAWLLAAGILFLGLQGMPDPGEGIYWYTGSVTYTLPSAVLWFLMAWYIKAWRLSWQIRPWRWLLLGSVAFVITGFNELNIVLILVSHVILLLFVRGSMGRVPKGLWLIAALVVAGSALMIAAPGNATRGGQFPLRHDLLRTAGWASVQTIRFLGMWLLSPVLLLAAVLAAGRLEWLRERWSPSRSQIGLLSLYLVSIVFIAMALPYWATGLLGQHRTVNATWLFILPGVIGLLLAVTLRFVPKPPPPRTRFVAAVLLVVAALLTGSSGTLSQDWLMGRFPTFDAQLQQRYGRLHEAAVAGAADLTLAPIADPPRAFHYLDGGSDPSGWVNRSMAFYFGADSTLVRVEAR